MDAILDRLRSFFVESEWAFDVDENQSIIRLEFEGDNTGWVTYAQAKEPQRQFVYYSVAPLDAPPDKLLAVAEMITRLNYGIPIGNFEMDFEDGEIRFKSSIDVEESELTDELIRPVVAASIFNMETYLPALIEVIETDDSPIDILERMELTA